MDEQLLEAARNGNEDDVARLLRLGAKVAAIDDDGFYPLHLASREGHDKVVRLLIEKGARIDARSMDEWGPGETALHSASWKGHDKVVRLLIGKGANIEDGDSELRSPLLCASSTGHDKVVRLLIDKGARIDAFDIEFDTALHYACMRGACQGGENVD